jgi:hypothetical protein
MRVLDLQPAQRLHAKEYSRVLGRNRDLAAEQAEVDRVYIWRTDQLIAGSNK